MSGKNLNLSQLTMKKYNKKQFKIKLEICEIIYHLLKDSQIKVDA